MRNPKRIPVILEQLRFYWEAHPDLRLCQLISSIASDTAYRGRADLFYVEDSLMAEALCKKINGEFFKDE